MSPCTCCSSSCAISVNRRSTLSQFLAEVWSRITLFIPLSSVGITLAVSPGGNTSRACWRTPPPRPRESRGRRGLSCYPPAPATPAHSRAQYHGPIRVEGYKAATNESSPWGWRTPRSPAASPGSSRRWAGWSRRTPGSGRGQTGSRTG